MYYKWKINWENVTPETNMTWSARGYLTLLGLLGLQDFCIFNNLCQTKFFTLACNQIILTHDSVGQHQLREKLQPEKVLDNNRGIWHRETK